VQLGDEASQQLAQQNLQIAVVARARLFAYIADYCGFP